MLIRYYIANIFSRNGYSINRVLQDNQRYLLEIDIATSNVNLNKELKKISFYIYRRVIAQ